MTDSEHTTDLSAEGRLLREFLTLAHIDSPPRREGQIMRVLAPQLTALGLRVHFDEAHLAVDGQVGNLIATLPATRPSAPPIFLSAHVDTVASTAGIKTIVSDGVVRTDGSTILGADDKSAVAAILEALRHIVSYEIPHGEVQILFSICEEIGLKGAAAMDLSLVKAKTGFVFDSSLPVGGIVTRSPSHDRIKAVIHGRKAHAGMRPEAGVSAIEIAAHAVSRMKLGRIDHESTANIGVIHGGEATNIVADRVEIEAEARSLDEVKLRSQVQSMTDALAAAAAERGGHADVNVSRHYSHFSIDETAPVLRLAREAIQAIGLTPRIGVSGGGSDASIFNARGLSSVVLGIGYRDIHTHQESMEVAELVRIYKLAVALIERAAEA